MITGTPDVGRPGGRTSRWSGVEVDVQSGAERDVDADPELTRPMSEYAFSPSPSTALRFLVCINNGKTNGWTNNEAHRRCASGRSGK